MAISQFRRSVVANTTNRNKGKGGGARGNWHDRMKLPQGSPIPFMFIPGSQYEDQNPTSDQIEVDPATGRARPVVNSYYKFRKHRRRLMKGTREFFPDEICSAGSDPHNPQPCAGCMAMDAGDKSVTVSDTFAFGIIDLRPYHGHPLVDRNKGGWVMKKDQSVFIAYDECTGRTCNYCRTLNGQQVVTQNGEQWPGYKASEITTVFGKRRYFELGKNHLADLEGWDQIIASQCSGTIRDANGNPVRKCGAQLITDGYACPTCQTLCVDMSSDPRSDEQIQEAVLRPYPCMNCQRSVLLQEVVSCDTCGNAVQNSLFNPDVVLWGMRQGEGTNSHLALQKFEGLSEFEYTVPKHLLGGRTIQQCIEDLAKPYDFSEVFRPKALEDQARRLELNINLPQQSATSPYAQQQTFSQPPATQQIMSVGIAQPQQSQQQSQPGPAPFVPGVRPNFGK